MSCIIWQVYIVAVKRDQEKDAVSTAEEDEYQEHPGESLLTLVQAELPTLSQNWFYALKDHALLSLPQGTQNVTNRGHV